MDNVTIDGFMITNGNASGPYPDQQGGGIYHEGGVNLNVVNCAIVNNSAFDGAIYANSGTSTISNCVFAGNTSTGHGGAICLSGGTQSWISNCVFYNNSAPFVAGGAFYDDSWGNNSLVNCTFYGNSTLPGGQGGAVNNSNPNLSVTNCILWGNQSADQPEISAYSSPMVTYSDIQGGYTGTGNISLDPQFVDAASGDFHLQATSPCVNAGTAAGAPATDLDANLRDTTPDMGAYEYGTGPANQPPVAQNSNVQTDKGVSADITLSATDPDPGDTLSFTIVN